MKVLLPFLLLCGLLACTHPPRPQETALPPEVQAEPGLARWLVELHLPQDFVSHPADGGSPGWLALPVSHEAVQKLVAGIEHIRGIELQDRGESHITVITPPEAQSIREQAGIPIEALEAYALPKLEAARWQVLGVGSARDLLKQTFFLVVDSPDLLALRRDLADVFQLDRDTFDPAAQDFHITIGFVQSDIWGVDKGRGSLQGDLGLDVLLGHP